MKVQALVPLGVFTARSLAESSNTFEPADFNVIDALVSNGVNVSALPELVALEKRSSFNPCSIACNSLKLIYGNKLLASGTTEYDAFTDSYWSLQARNVDPFCVFEPTKALEVSTLVLVSRLTQCPFAIKSGGHTFFKGASSIEGGITVSLEGMNEVTLSSDKKIAAIGAGNRWGRVYTELLPYELAVTGGRASDVGVGGLLLGGGISHQSNIYGFGCDNVASYEVVTASGIIVTASPTQLPDLYWALRGGGSNFGIVTKFNLETIPQGLLWGGIRVHLQPDYAAMIDAFASLIEDNVEDPNAVQITSFAVTNGSTAAQVELEYLKPVDKSNPPKILQKYLAINSALVKDTTANYTLVQVADVLSNSMPAGRRHSMWASTYKLDRDLITWMVNHYQETVVPLFGAAQAAFSIQGFSVPAMTQMSKKGGNTLPLDPADGPLFHVLMYMNWYNEAEDAKFQKASQNLVNEMKAEATRRGLAHDYIYQPYASPYQAVIPAYGAETVQKMKAIANKYDPTSVFQKLLPGGFKLDGAPYGEVIV